MPQEQFLKAWDEAAGDAKERISLLNQKFKVSELVIARLALTTNKITPENYWEIHTEVMRNFEDYRRRLRESDGGPSAMVMLPIKNSRKITKTVIDLVKSNQLGTAEASVLLNVSATRIFSL